MINLEETTMAQHTHEENTAPQGRPPRPESLVHVKTQQLSAAQHESSVWQAAYLELQASLEEVLGAKDDRIRELEAELVNQSNPRE